MTYAPMPTLGHVSSEGLEKTRFTKPDSRKYWPHFQQVSPLLEMSVVKQIQKNKHMFKSSAHFAIWWGSTIKEAKFPELQFSCGYAFDNMK